MFGRIPQWCNLVLDFSLQGVLFVCLLFTDSILLLVIGLFKLFLLDSVLVGCMFLETCPFLLCFPNCWHIIVHSILFRFLYFCGISCYFFSFISYFVYLDPPCFLLDESGQRFDDFGFCLPFQRTSPWFYWFFLFKIPQILNQILETQRVEVIEAELEVIT